MNKNSFLKDTLIFTFIMVILGSLIAFVDNTTLFMIGFPVVIALFTYRHGPFKGLFLAMLSALFILPMNSLLWLMVLFLFSATGAVMGAMIRGKKPHENAIFATVIATMIALSFTTSTAVDLYEIKNFPTIIESSINQMDFPDELLQSIPLIKSETGSASDIAELKREVKNLLFSTIPALLVIFITLYVLLAYSLTLYILRLLKQPLKPGSAFSDLTLPGNPIIGTALLIFGALIVSWLNSDMGDILILNTFYVVVFIFAIQGLSVGAYLLKNAGVNKILRTIILIVVFLFLQLLGFSIVGWIDLSFGIKKRIVRKV